MAFGTPWERVPQFPVSTACYPAVTCSNAPSCIVLSALTGGIEMVFVNDQKFACESCIKGHRSSSCKHANRPLFEIKKKGRPISQCEKCRELRQSKRVHSKCLCNFTDGLNIDPCAAQSSPPRKKTGRFVPITPSLPNGISDVVSSYGSGSVSTHSKQRVDALLNPCTCISLRKCRCWSRPGHSRVDTLPSASASVTTQNGLATLARAAALSCGGQSSSVSPNVATSKSALTPVNGRNQNSKRQSSRPSTPPNVFHKRQRHISSNQQPKCSVPGPSLPPILTSPLSSSTSCHQVPSFPTIPPIGVMTSLAGSGCTCGLLCACPDCPEHRGEEYASASKAHCADGCGTCVDWQGGIGLPATNQLTGGQSKSIVNQFYACAAALPSPPQTRNRSTSVSIDPTNVLVYPPDLFSNPSGTSSPTSHKAMGGFDMEARDAAFGLIKVPKLECCGGRCSCPADGCGCGKSCEGQCEEHELEDSNPHTASAPPASDEQSSQSITPSTASKGVNLRTSPSAVPAVRSCCAKRLATRL